jgi:phage gp29-like protein
MNRYKRNIPDAIRGLTLERLTSQLDGYRNGNIASFGVTAEAMEERDDILRNVILKRKKAVTRHDWEVLTVDDSPEAQEHQRALDYFYRNLTCTYALKEDQRGGFGLLVHQMLDALGKGWAVHEITWKPRVKSAVRKAEAEKKVSLLTSAATAREIYLTAELRFVPLWFFENTTGRLRFLAKQGQVEGEPMKEREWLVTAADALMVPCSRAFLLKHFPLQSWLDYCLKYGLPAVRGATSAARNTPEWDAMVKAVEEFLSELTIVTNTTESIEVVDLKGHSTQPFSELVERMDRMMAALWRGADLSTISRDRGYGASLQEKESRVLEKDDAQLISDTLHRTLDLWVVKYLFGEDVEPKAYLQIMVANESTEHDLAVDDFLISHGAKLSLADAMERYGRSPAMKGERALESGEMAQVRNEQAPQQSRARQQASSANREDWGYKREEGAGTFTEGNEGKEEQFITSN